MQPGAAGHSYLSSFLLPFPSSYYITTTSLRLQLKNLFRCSSKPAKANVIAPISYFIPTLPSLLLSSQTPSVIPVNHQLYLILTAPPVQLAAFSSRLQASFV
ncbi:MAG: hypothetical protein FRX48_01771 [Lasallia pustulata]|uniref:Uncharacterized protein n=1 Tax=Lasallia pustulata TaxID=136370 RepID=A0A5M8Q1C2_9LECA|nr:MAG: hypothetical protein FRX48_01771 [Lasallia pustulata]